MRDETEPITLQLEDCGIDGPAKAGGALDTASNTGWRSVGELAMTCRISGVAVCCSRASVRRSPEAFDLALRIWRMTAWWAR